MDRAHLGESTECLNVSIGLELEFTIAVEIFHLRFLTRKKVLIN